LAGNPLALPRYRRAPTRPRAHSFAGAARRALSALHLILKEVFGMAAERLRAPRRWKWVTESHRAPAAEPDRRGRRCWLRPRGTHKRS